MTAFADLEARTNTAVMDRLANAEADLGGGVMLAGIMEADPVLSYGVVSGYRPIFTVLSSAAPAQGSGIALGGKAFVVAGHERDGSGFTKLILEEA